MIEFWSIIVLVYMFPMTWPRLGWVDGMMRVVIFCSVVVLLSVHSWYRGFVPTISTISDHAWVVYPLVVLSGSLIISCFARFENRQFVWLVGPADTVLSFVVSLFQQWVYFIILLPWAIAHLGPWWGMLVAVVMFVWLHIIYPETLWAYVLIAIAGMGFVCLYVYAPAPILAILTHMVLNLVAVSYGYFIPPESSWHKIRNTRTSS